VLIVVVLAFFLFSPTMRQLDKDARLTGIQEVGD